MAQQRQQTAIAEEKRATEYLANESYKVARWGVDSAQSVGDPVWDVVEQYLKSAPFVKNHTPNVPRLIGLDSNPGFAND